MLLLYVATSRTLVPEGSLGAVARGRRPRLARIRRIRMRRPQRTPRPHRLRPADRAQEPVPGLAAAHRTAHRITPRLARNGLLAPRARPRHDRAPHSDARQYVHAVWGPFGDHTTRTRPDNSHVIEHPAIPAQPS